MKNSFIITLLLVITNCISQTNDHIVFDYDAAGNQIKRYLIDIDPGKHSNPNPKPIEDITESDLTKADIYDDIKYYPNPVKEDLYIKWELVNNNAVQSISLYNINGQFIRQVSNLQKLDNYVFSFQGLPQGVYSINLVYSNGEKKSLKILKSSTN